MTRRTAQTETASTITPISAIEMMNCHDTEGAPCGSVVANDSHWPSRELDRHLQAAPGAEAAEARPHHAVHHPAHAARFTHRPGKRPAIERRAERRAGRPVRRLQHRRPHLAVGQSGSCWRT